MIEKCPKCGGTTGYTSYSYARGVVKYDKPWSDKPRNRLDLSTTLKTLNPKP